MSATLRDLEDGVNWYLKFMYMSGASTAEMTEVHTHLFHVFRKLYDAGFIDEPVRPELPEEMNEDHANARADFVKTTRG